MNKLIVITLATAFIVTALLVSIFVVSFVLFIGGLISSHG